MLLLLLLLEAVVVLARVVHPGSFAHSNLQLFLQVLQEGCTPSSHTCAAVESTCL